jgi:hypothetical protein
MQVIVPPSFRSAIAVLAPGTGTNEPVTPWFKDTYSMDPGPHHPRNRGRVLGAEGANGPTTAGGALPLEKRKDMLAIS